MSESKKQILEELIRFLKDERELYGDWNPGFNPKKVDTMNKRDYPQTGSANESLSSKDKISKQDTGQPQRDSQKESAKKNSAGSSAHDSLRLFQSGSPAKLDEQLKACANLNQLRELCEQSQDLKTDLEGTNLVFGVGDPGADLMLIGEAPGYYEDQQGEPFVGKAGQLLNKILEAIRFKREDVYISNILKHRPPKNRDPKPEERQKSLPYLM
ncbi:MAG: uracil-DNA glycosylase, partial [Balneolaceae bacterium]